MARVTLSDGVVERLRTRKVQEEVFDNAHVLGGSFGVRVSRGGRKVFFLVLPAEMRRKRMTLGVYPLLSLAEARIRAARVLRARSLGEEIELPPNTVGELIELFFERVLPGKSPATTREYRRLLEVEILPVWRSRPLREIQASDVYHLLDRVAVKRAKPVLAERLRSILSRLFQLALERHLVEENPVRATEPVHRRQAGDRTLSAAQLERLWTALDDEPLQIRAIFRLLLLTGQRVNDLLSMKWSDLVLDEWRVSRRSTRIPLSVQAHSLLMELRDSATSDLVFPGKNGKGQKEIRKFTKRLNRKLGDTGEHEWTSRELRRTVEVGMRSLRIRPDVIEQALGRQTITPASARMRSEYDYRDDLRAAFAAWDRRLAEISGPSPDPDKSVAPRKEQRQSSSNVVPLFPRR